MHSFLSFATELYFRGFRGNVKVIVIQFRAQRGGRVCQQALLLEVSTVLVEAAGGRNITEHIIHARGRKLLIELPYGVCSTVS